MAEEGRVEAYLKAQRSQIARPLRLVVGAGLGVGLLVIVQAWLVARVATAVLFEKATLADVSGELTVLPAVFLARAVLTYAGEVSSFRAAAQVKRSLRRMLLEHLVALGPVRLSRQQTGVMATALTDSVEAIHPYYARYLPAASLTAVLPIVILVIVFPSDWVSGVVFILTAPLIPLFMILIGHGAEKMNQRQWGTLLRMSGHLLDAIQGLTTLKLFNASRREAAVVSAMAESYRRDTMSVLRVAFLSSLALEFFATVSIAIVAVLIGFRLLWGEMTFFNGFLVLLLAPEFYAPLRALGAHYHARMEAIGAAEKIVDFLEMPAPAARQEPVRLNLKAPPRIVFENVRVVHDDGRCGLDHLSFVIAAGEKVALVGPSGAGKSTVLNLLLGFLSPTSGRILVDGVPLEEIDPADWCRHIAWVPQSPHIFRESVADNIAMSASSDDARVRERVVLAGQQALVHDVISRLPRGYDTILAETGADLSGGEVQRIAIARAFFRQPSLVLLDEPTAHIDPQTESELLEATEGLVAGRTSLAIAHRLETARRADRILVLDNGRLVEHGQPAELLRSNGLYARLATSATTEDGG